MRKHNTYLSSQLVGLILLLILWRRIVESIMKVTMQGRKHNESNDTGAALIVEFPPNRGSRDTTCRVVSFNQMSSLAFIDEDKSGGKAYSTEDIRRFKAELAVDIQRMRRDLASNTTYEDADDQKIYNYVGLERYTSKSIAKRSMAARRAQIKAVLDTQKMMQEKVSADITDEFKIMEISRASMRSSRWARIRATKLAAAFSSF